MNVAGPPPGERLALALVYVACLALAVITARAVDHCAPTAGARP